ncbi:NUDIX hydrolase [Sporosarcina sp. Te-1]|uniref:NUDIX hydrolase n=1 Tax=Sporosarcina sp. Te-1 TaxID=2818390 RepID=UPI001A9F795C|nr:NUDIX hydrolase [Sporosarcina sp. Te-1]QTD39674.1 NUDIX hydrolase [Sporosarcina sp. Te-1]
MDYIRTMRKLVGQRPLLTVGCGVILTKDDRILLQHRVDEDNWCIPGGVMVIGETFEETAKRETFEETGMHVGALRLFGLYSGDACFVTYPNGDEMYSVQVIFISSDFTDNIIQSGSESQSHHFFNKEELPLNLNPRQRQFIEEWASGKNSYNDD